jgi:hypothetical protein
MKKMNIFAMSLLASLTLYANAHVNEHTVTCTGKTDPEQINSNIIAVWTIDHSTQKFMFSATYDGRHNKLSGTFKRSEEISVSGGKNNDNHLSYLYITALGGRVELVNAGDVKGNKNTYELSTLYYADPKNDSVWLRIANIYTVDPDDIDYGAPRSFDKFMKGYYLTAPFTNEKIELNCKYED